MATLSRQFDVIQSQLKGRLHEVCPDEVYLLACPGGTAFMALPDGGRPSLAAGSTSPWPGAQDYVRVEKASLALSTQMHSFLHALEWGLGVTSCFKFLP